MREILDRRGDEPALAVVLDYREDDNPVHFLNPWVTWEKYGSGSHWTHRPFEDAIRW